VLESTAPCVLLLLYHRYTNIRIILFCIQLNVPSDLCLVYTAYRQTSSCVLEPLNCIHWSCIQNTPAACVIDLPALQYVLQLMHHRNSDRREKAKGIPRLCQGIVIPASLGYPLSVQSKLYSQKQVILFKHHQYWSCIQNTPAACVIVLPALQYVLQSMHHRNSDRREKAKGIPRLCQGMVIPASLGYPLSVFNQNSTLKSKSVICWLPVFILYTVYTSNMHYCSWRRITFTWKRMECKDTSLLRVSHSFEHTKRKKNPAIWSGLAFVISFSKRVVQMFWEKCWLTKDCNRRFINPFHKDSNSEVNCV